MKEEEKAKELVDKFKQYSYYDAHDLTTRRAREESNIESAKECALIAVDEILKVRPIIPSPMPSESITDCCIQANDFWQQVKTEIEKL